MTDLSRTSPPETETEEASPPSAPRPSPGLRSWLRHLLQPKRADGNALRDAIEELIEEEGDHGDSLDASERALLGNILKLRDRTVFDCMVPRVDIVGLEIETPSPEIVSKVVKEGHSRFPVFRESLDEVVGIIHVKDIMALMAAERELRLGELVREVQIVAPSMRVLELLLQMRENRQHMAMVVDEFGGIDGLVTIEDLVEQIVGEIEDEHDDSIAPSLSLRSDGTLIADARITLEKFEEEVGAVFSESEREEVDTLAGLVVALTGRVPARGELLSHVSGMDFEIIDADPRRIKRIRVRNLPRPNQDEVGG